MFATNYARLIAGVLFLLLLTACSTPMTSALRQDVSTSLNRHVELSELVFYPQELHQCGPASLAMLMHSSGVDLQPEQLKDYLYLPEKQGSLQVEMLAAARRNGLLAYQLQTSLRDVLAEVAGGNPVLVLQNLGLSWYPVWHYAVVIGYDREREEIILRSGLDYRQVLPFSTFEHTWARSKHWAMVAIPPGKLPHTAAEDRYIASLAALAHSQPTIELWLAYAAALQRWPNSLLVMIAAGNHAYEHGELHLAEQMFLRATQAHPDSAAAFNNLAHTLKELGQYRAAIVAVQRALELGGPLVAVARKTLSEIEQGNRATKP
jgi:tetratricopeptide (TPR) repeat protein